VERIDFYILAAPDLQAGALFACRLADKAFGQGLRIYVRVRDRQQALQLDELLWTFRQGSFLPHALAERAPDEPIVLGEQPPAEPQHDLIINLATDPPAHWQNYRRLAEVVVQAPAELEQARARFRLYRDHGHAPNYHKLERES